MSVASVLTVSVLALSLAWAASASGDGSVVILHGEDLKGAAERLREAIPGLKRIIGERTGFGAEFPFTIEIVRDREDFVRLSGGPLFAGVAIPGENRILLDLSQMRVHPANLELMALHEMCHLALHRNIQGELLPKWLDEGVSQWVSGGVNEILISPGADTLAAAALSDRLLGFEELREEFPGEKSAMALAYSQSRSIVEHLEAEFGEAAVRGVLRRLSEGLPLPEALKKELGAELPQIEKSWRKTLKSRYGWAAYLSDNLSWLLFVLGAILLVFAFARLRRRIRDYPDEDESRPHEDA